MPIEEASQVAHLRYYAISAFISSWQTVCNFKLCRKAALKTGWFPFDENAAASSQFAVERTEEQDNAYLQRRQARTRLDINSTIINATEFIDRIAQSLAAHPHLGHLIHSPVPEGAQGRHGHYDDGGIVEERHTVMESTVNHNTCKVSVKIRNTYCLPHFFCTVYRTDGVTHLPTFSPSNFQKTVFRLAKGHLLERKRPSFGS